MKKYLKFFVVPVIACVSFYACGGDDDNDDPEPEKTEYRVKSVKFIRNYEDMNEANAEWDLWTYTYGADGKLTGMTYGGEDWTDTYTLTYTSGKITLARTGSDYSKTLDVDAKGNVIKAANMDKVGEDITFTYNSDGFMTRIFKVANGSSEEKCEFTIINGNVTSFYKYKNDIQRFKNFVYASGENTGNIYQAVNDSFFWGEWEGLLYAGIFGAPSKNLSTSVSWSDTPETVTNMSFEFETDGRVKRMKRTDNVKWFEYYDYTYEEITK